MIKAIEKDYLNDNYINKIIISNLKISEKINFSKNDIYYFGNYDEDKLTLINDKLIKNKKSLIKAIENNIKFIICGNSYELFNNLFNHKNLNIFTAYNSKEFKCKFKKIRFKKEKYNNSLKIVDNLKKPIDNENFKYKNFLCIKDPNLIEKIIKNKVKLLCHANGKW